VHERHRSPYPSPSRSPWRSSKCPTERKLRTTECSRWPRNGCVLGWSDPTFCHLCVAKRPQGSLQPNQSDERSKRFVGQTGVRAMQSFPVAPDGHPHFTSSSSTIEVEVKSSSPLYFIGGFASHFTGSAAPWLSKSIRCTFQRGPNCTCTGTMGGRERPHPLTHGASPVS